jgi:hypothetical protein
MSSNYVALEKLIIPTPDAAKLSVETVPLARVHTKSGSTTTNKLGYLLKRTWTLECKLTSVEAKQIEGLYHKLGNSVPFLFRDPLEPSATQNLSVFSGDTGACGCILESNSVGIPQLMIAYFAGGSDLDCVSFRPIFHAENIVWTPGTSTADPVTRLITPNPQVADRVSPASFDYWQAYKFQSVSTDYAVKHNSIAIGRQNDTVVNCSIVLKESYDWMTPANSLFKVSI